MPLFPRKRESILTVIFSCLSGSAGLRLALRASQLLLALPKSNQKARHRTRRSDSHRANRTALRFSGTAGSAESTSMCSQPTRAHRARAPSGNFRRTLRCSAPRTAPVCARTRASLHCADTIVRSWTNLPQEQAVRAIASAAGCRPNGAPCGAASGWRKSPKGARAGCARGRCAHSEGRMPGERATGGVFLWLLSLHKQRK